MISNRGHAQLGDASGTFVGLTASIDAFFAVGFAVGLGVGFSVGLGVGCTGNSTPTVNTMHIGAHACTSRGVSCARAACQEREIV